jgi:hypothetical protein
MSPKATVLLKQGVPWRPSSILLLLAGLAVIGIGIYFLFLRPPLLAEDVRFLQMGEADISASAPRLAAWLSNVFHVLGGYAVATGLLAMALAGTAYRRRDPLAVLGVATSGISGIGLMAVTNFTIGSDFRWLLLALALLWAASLACYALEALRILSLKGTG